MWLLHHHNWPEGANCGEWLLIFKLKETKGKSLLIKTADQIVRDKNIINNLSIEDVNSISYIAGYECFQNNTYFKENS